MIAYLEGKPVITNGTLIILVGGVGYGVRVNDKTLAWAQRQENCGLHIYTHVKEDVLELFGFKEAQEKDVFELVLGVSGVGPAIAMNLVGAGSNQLTEAVQEAKVSFFTAVPRVGKKLAQKIIIELRGKLGELKSLNLGPNSQLEQDVIDSLTGMGFATDQVEEAIKDIDLESISVDEAVKIIIKSLRKNKL